MRLARTIKIQVLNALRAAQANKDDFYSWFATTSEPQKEFEELSAANPNAWQPTIDDVINEIANQYGDTYEQYLAISNYLQAYK